MLLPLSEATLSKFGYHPDSVTHGSRKVVVFRCNFCLQDFDSTKKSVARSSFPTCGKCTGVSAAYHAEPSIISPNEFYLIWYKAPDLKNIDIEATRIECGVDPTLLRASSIKLVIAKCSFCLSLFKTKFAILNKGRSWVACKKCDAIASWFSREKEPMDPHKYYLSRQKVIDSSNLDIQATVSAFGYDPTQINSYSTKKIIAKCAYCYANITLKMAKYSGSLGKPACKKCIKSKTIETLQKRYGVSCTLLIPAVLDKLKDPLTERIVESILRDRYKVRYIRNYPIGPYAFDFWVPDANLLIECHGDYFHGFKEHGYSGTPKDRTKSSYIENNTSYRLVWIYEHEIHAGRITKILDAQINSHIDPPIEFDKSELFFARLDPAEAHSFLSQYHYMGNLGTVVIPYGAKYKDSLIAVCVFGGVTRNQTIAKVNKFAGTAYGPSGLRELRRFCIRPNVPRKNLASYCLKRFLSLFSSEFVNIRAVVSFSDETVEDSGTIYKASNWSNAWKTGGSYHYLDIETGRPIHKKTVWDCAKGSHMSEVRFANKSGFIRVEESPKTCWLRIFST